MKKHVNIPIFIPHIGCPNLCTFCNQRTISGTQHFDEASVDTIISDALSTVDEKTECEIAFFGGSFTGIDRELMLRLLRCAYKYIESGRVKSIRCSTRPDYIDKEVLDILKRYGVKTVELGIQSISDRVLAATKRGHTFLDTERAVMLVVENGFELVGQMMIGLPSSTPEDELATAEFIVNSGAKGARIYPTVVFFGTELCDMAVRGEYTPLDLEGAVKRSSSVLRVFNEGRVEVIRIGLCASESLSDTSTCYAGPNHSALGELVMGELYFENIINKINNECSKSDATPTITVLVPRGAVSKACGHGRINIKRLTELYGFKDVVIREDSSLMPYEVRISREREKLCT